MIEFEYVARFDDKKAQLAYRDSICIKVLYYFVNRKTTLVSMVKANKDIS